MSAPAPNITVLPGFIPEVEAAVYLDQLLREIPWSQPSLRMFGKLVPIPRLQALYVDPAAPLVYSYSGLKMESFPFEGAMAGLLQLVADRCAIPFNTALANLYRNGQDSMGWHADDEASLGPAPIIASLSLGASRSFQFRSKADHALRHKLLLYSGDLLIMHPPTQAEWQHALPRQSKISTQRVNLTFRLVV
jgi:alkylated DNA repair dioxygenase AlkB